ncbi:MAG: thiopurine S-methyltransferase [Pseudomonadota bacterium]
MDSEFWQTRWRNNEIGFHEGQPNLLLREHFHQLNLTEGSQIFVPLCGKAMDLDWLAGNGHQVIGIELNQTAVEEVFKRNDLAPDIHAGEHHLRYRAAGLEIFVGDFFHLSSEMIGVIDAVYDRAALVALPAPMRRKYAQHLYDITGGTHQLTITFDYDQAQMDGPPFSIPAEEVAALYGDKYHFELVASQKISGPLSKRCAGTENAWLLKAN